MNEKLKDKKISAISLGCDKNRVDLEKMLFALSDYGFEIVENVQDSNIVIINTCAFISPSREEALENIFDMCLLKSKNRLEKVIVSGCLSQRYKADLQKQIPEVDAFLTLEENDNIVQIIENLYDIKHSKTKTRKGRIFTNRGAYAYLKIAEGCNNACSYCTIPRIKGRYVSYKMEDIVEEAKYLAKKNVKELILVAQDVTRYGEDLYGKSKLIELCQNLAKIPGIEWIRLHYGYPEKISKELLEFVEKEKKMCKYLDIPLQHIDERILKSMRRRLGESDTRALVQKIKNEHPDIALRTTFIVGYPSESREDFKKLYNFVEETEFDYAGFFPYYREENTSSFYIQNQLSNFTKKKRLKKIKKVQNRIATKKAVCRLGKIYKVLLDYFDETEGVFVGHTEFLSPTVDFGVKIVDNGNMKAGDFVNVKFVDFDGENFKGECYESSK